MSRPKRYTPLASVVSRDAHDHCVVTGCLRRPMAWGGAYCTRHHHRAFENGHHDATVVTIRELAQFHDWIDSGLRIYRDSSAVRIALARAERLLHFTPLQGHDWETYFAGRMSAVRCKAGIPVDARRVLITALTYFAFESAHPERIMTSDVRNIGLARSLIRLGKCKQPAAKKSNLVPCGAHVAQEMGTFAIHFLNLLKRRTRADNLKRQCEDEALRDFTIPNDEPARCTSAA